jgi:hypothetical protein
VETDRVTDDRDWVIWSFEHRAWWRPGRMGYSVEIDRAGRYTEQEARAIVRDANRYSATAQEIAIHLTDDTRLIL